MISSTEEQKMEHYTMEFLTLFNAIDKQFDKILHIQEFLSFNEKIKRVATGNYSISWFVKMHQYQLRYFGELRNHITDGIKLQGHTMAYPSRYAIQKLERFKNAILQPPKALDIFGGKVYTCLDTQNILQTYFR